jgi:site-specific recombinase XerC
MQPSLASLSPPPTLARADLPFDPSIALSWDEAVRAFLVDLASRGFSSLTLRDYQGDVDRLRRSVSVAPADLSDAAIETALAAWRREGAASVALRRHRSALRKFLGFLRRTAEGAVGGAEIWRRAASSPPCERLLLGFVAAAGARLPELCALEGRDLRLRAGEVRLRAGLRLVPLHPALTELIVATKDELPSAPFRPLFGGRQGFVVNTRTMHARFRRAAIRIGAPDLRPDDLRRELAAHLVSVKTPPGLVAAFLGRDRGRPVAPRRGTLTDLSCLAERLASYPLGSRPALSDEGADGGAP